MEETLSYVSSSLLEFVLHLSGSLCNAHLEESMKSNTCESVTVMFDSIYLFTFCSLIAVIVKATNGPRYVVGCRRQVGSDHVLMCVLGRLLQIISPLYFMLV